MLAKIVGVLLVILGALMAVSVFQVSKALIVGGYGDERDALIKGYFVLAMVVISLYVVKKGVDACRTHKANPAHDDAHRD